MEFRPNAFKITLLFPLYDNLGQPFPEIVWDWWRTEFTGIVPAYTETGPVVGWWQGQTDRNRMVYVILKSDDTERIRRLREFVAEARYRFRQASMYFEMHPVQYEEL
jgi:hypothetical protein